MVFGFRCQAGEDVTGGAGGSGHIGPSGIAGNAVIDIPSSLADAGGPTKHHGVGGHPFDKEVGRNTGGGGITGHDKADIGAVGAGAVVARHGRRNTRNGEGCVVAIAIDATVGTGIGGIAREARGVVCCTGRLIDKGGKHKVRNAIPEEGSVEGVFHHTYMRSGTNAGVDLRHAARKGSEGAKGAIGSVTQEDDQLFLIGTRRIPMIGNAADGTSREPHGGEFTGGIDALTEGIAPAGIAGKVGGGSSGA